MQQVVEYDVTEAAIAEMGEKYLSLTINGLDDKEGFKAVHAGRMDVKGKRIAVEKRRKELKKDALEYGRKVDAKAKSIFDLLAPIESHLQAEEDKIIKEKERIKAEADRAEQERIDCIRARISGLLKTANVTGFDSTAIQKQIEAVGNVDINEDEYMEFYQEALETGEAVLAELNKSLEAQLAVEKADAERKAENERLEKIRLEQEAEAERLRKTQEEQEAKARAEREAIEAEKRKIQEEKDRLEAEKRAEQERKDREEFERKAKEEARIKAEQEAKEKAERIERERIAAKKRAEEERLRQEALAPDKEKILAWVALFNQDNLPTPNVKSDEAKDIVAEAENAIIEALQTAEDEAKAL